MSLAFLAKKSWHTANLRNVEKVWIAEQKHAAEEQKMEELRKNIEEERQLKELRELQASNGDKSATRERVDWMYEAPQAKADNSAEDYLLGKEYKPAESKSDAQQLTKQASHYGPQSTSQSALPSNDRFSRLHEDPLMAIKKQQQSAQESVLKNPVKMKQIQEKVEAMKKEKKAAKKAKKKAKKEAKRSKKEAKRGVKSSSRDQTDKVEATEPSERRQSRSRSPRPTSRFERRSRSRSPERSYRSERRERRRSHSRSRSRSRHNRRRSRSRDRSSRRSSDRHSRRSSYRRSPEVKRRHDDSPHDHEARPKRDGKYGLIQTDGSAPCKDVDASSLGPNARHLTKAREARRREEEERREKLSKRSNRDRKRLSSEERQRLAKQMIEDGERREAEIAQHASAKEQVEEEALRNPKFLQDVQNSYGDKDKSLGDHLRRNVNYVQKHADSSNFL